MATEKVYWKGFDQLANTEVAQRMAQNEFAQEIPVDQFLGNESIMGKAQTSRRDFLKYLGFSTAAATLAACESPIIESIPYVVKPDSLTPSTRATPVRHPRAASEPSEARSQGFVACPRSTAARFRARCAPWRTACWAVAG